MKTRREAIENLEYLISGECCDSHMDYIDEIQMAITDMKICDANNTGWVSLKDKFPPLDEEVLVNTLYGMRVFSLTQSAHETSDVYWEDSYGYYQEIPTVTHWMPLPEPPKEET